MTDLAEVIRLEPQYVQAYLTRAQMLLEAGQPEEALADCNRALEHDPQSVYAFQCRAEVWQAMGEQEKAQADLKQAERLGSAAAGERDSA
jgi:Tfp pilus assembly protein PilF